MVQIKNIGRFCAKDHDHVLVNEASMEKVSPAFQEVIDYTLEQYLHHFGNHIHSIYLRGSIPHGLGIEGVSDLDTIVITNDDESVDSPMIEQLEEDVNRRFPVIDGLEIGLYPKEDRWFADRCSMIPFMLKTHSICVYGEDLRPALPNYHAGIALGNEHLVHLRTQIEQAKAELIDNEDPEDINDCCSWIMKIIVRAGLALVIDQENQYTRDLYPAYQVFAAYFPEQETEMREVLQLAIEPTDQPTIIIGVLDGIGAWMTNQAALWLQTYNPRQEQHMRIVSS